MIISYQWLLEYLPEPLPVNELSNILTSIGLEVEAVERAETVAGGLEGLIIGEVLTCEKHPNADKLSLTTVTIGGPEPLHIVCGAPNIAAGQKVVVAPVGATVHPTEGTPFLIKKAKIRGADSEGMICAEDEIGLGKSHEGVLVLPPGAEVGMLAKAYFKIPEADFAIHIGLTPNRSDANSHIGVARDVCAYLTHHRDKKYVVRIHSAALPQTPADTKIRVSIEAQEACPRYAGISLKNVKVGASPEWLKQRLQTIGLRSINNIVDITNYVLHEYGQPLHAFDADKIRGKEINVRFLPEGTTFKALDEKERKLQGNDLMICDAEGPLAMGGVFGGLDSGITGATTNVFIESAYFDPKYIRRTSLHHGLRTDAATHFEKGVDINSVIPALKRAANLIIEMAGAALDSAMTDEYPVPLQATEVTVTYAYIRKLSGKAYHHVAIQEILVASGFGIIHETGDALTLKVPSNKADVSQPADIVEEILRIDGLDNIEIPQRLNISLVKTENKDGKERERIAELLCGMGLQEIVTNSIVNSKFYPERTDLVRMLNSLSADLDVMRPSMLESGLEVIAYNSNRRNQELRLFELGNVYHHTDGRYIQEPRLAIWMTGNVQPAHWNRKAQVADIYYLKGVLSNMLAYGGIKGYSVSTGRDESGETITWRWRDRVICTASQVPAQRLNIFDIKQPVCFADIHWDVWVKAHSAHSIVYKEVPKFPSVSRDLAIILDKHTTYQQVEEATQQLKLNSLQAFGLFDVFESEKLGNGKKSLALNYTFQLHDRTLTDAEIEIFMKQLTDAYKNKLSAQIRE